MELAELKEIVRNSGVVGAGGAGFPTYMKLDSRIETIILNCAECEPLLRLHRQLLRDRTHEILKTFSNIAKAVGAKSAIVAVKKSYVETVESVEGLLSEFEGMSIHKLKSAYPMGDEVVLIYECTGKVIRPGGLPIEEGVAVINVETVYNVFRAVDKGIPVQSKYVTVIGEVEHPVTVRVPIGYSIRETVALAGGITTPHPVYLIGGPMMGYLGSDKAPVTKTTNAVIVLPEDHIVVQKKRRSSAIDLKRAASTCCQCQMCTDLCPRHLLGHPITPHKFMRSAANQDFRDINPFLETMYCSSCGLCEMYSCPQGLAPRSLIADYKAELKKAGVPPKKYDLEPVSDAREYRRAPEVRLEARLGLYKYHKPAPIDHTEIEATYVRIMLNQHIGAPAVPIVQKGDAVTRGQMIAKPADGLSVAIHASIDGEVFDVSKTYIIIERPKKGRND